MLPVWSPRYDQLREVTRDDVLGYIADLYVRIRLGEREHAVWQPLDAGHLADAVAAATTLQPTSVSFASVPTEVPD